MLRPNLLWLALALGLAACDDVDEAAPVADGGAEDQTPADAADQTPADAADASVGDAEPPIELDFVRIEGGEFWMGDDDNELAGPRHLVTVPTFEIMRHEVTLAEYQACQQAEVCRPFAEQSLASCRVTDGEPTQAVICTTYSDALTFARWAGARLPSEAEWEFAATSRGTRHPYPWGEAEPTCDLAVMTNESFPGEAGDVGCGREGPWPVCSRPAGNTEQGLCDMAGNAAEWTLDRWCPYPERPRDASPLECDSTSAIARGGSWYDTADRMGTSLRSAFSIEPNPGARYGAMGFRLAQAVR